MTEKFFNATSIELGHCKAPSCRAVHLHLLDAGGVVRAQAVFACDAIEDLIADLRTVRDLVPNIKIDSGVRH
jgi:hypothetical protein